MEWLGVAGGLALLGYGIWLFADFVADTISDRLRGRIAHD